MSFPYFRGQNKYKIKDSVHCSARPKKVISIEVRKLSILALKCTFLVKIGKANTQLIIVSVYSTWDI